MTSRTANSTHVRLVEKACRFIEENLENELTLSVLGKQVSVSPAHLQRIFKQVLGITPKQFTDACRLTKLKRQLKRSKTVTTAMYEAGYSSSSRLYERSSEKLGMTPADYQRGGKGMSICYTINDCPLDRLLLAGTDRGICALCFGADDSYLESALVAEFPKAEISKDHATLKDWLDEVLRQMRGGTPAVDLPLDVRATAFQRRVWEELRKIPRGSTKTYREIAVSIGRPTAARAVARACATNPVSLVIPCHRVIREDGGLGGYRWGIERKEKLLEQEKEKCKS